MKNAPFIIIVTLIVGISIGYVISNRRSEPRLCEIEEQTIRTQYADYAARQGANQAIRTLITAKMYEDLAAYGCPENREDYLAAAEYNMRRTHEMLSLAVQPAANEIVIDMQQISETMNEVTREVQEVVREMADAIGEFMHRMRNTRINIVVE